MWGIARALRARGILGINQRNGDFILPFNQRKFYPLVDDKILTKKLAAQTGLAVPQLYHVVEIAHQIRELPTKLRSLEDFVIKPASGSGGNGVLVFTGTLKDRFRTIHGPLLNEQQIEHHVLNILSGMYSLAGQPDRAMIEYRVKSDPLFEKVTYRGVPDIRIIVFLGVPVMAMLRLPTSQSDGKANLHQGAIGVGISIRDGKTMTAVSGTSIISEHPDTGESVIGIQLPHWDALLHIAAGSTALTGLGYQGVDIVLDKDFGPMILEMNARPGLAIQLANSTGLLNRLTLVKKHRSSLTTSASCIKFAQENF